MLRSTKHFGRFLSYVNKIMTPTPEQIATKSTQVESQGALVRKLKAEGAPKEKITSALDDLKKLKEELKKLEAELPQVASSSAEKNIDRQVLDELLRKRFFFAPSFGVYGGVSGLYDYGPPGCALQANILDLWRKHFVLEEDMLEVDCSVLTPHDVLKTSGHVDRFADLMCKDLKTGEIFRVDHLVEHELERRLEEDQLARDTTAKKPKGKELVRLSEEERSEYHHVLAQIDGYSADQLSNLISKFNIVSPNGNPLSAPEIFNLMFGTNIGPTGLLKGYLRPETAQGQFLNFKKLLEFNNERMPFASAQIGRSFRNEISPRSGLLRVREFTMAEIEHYVNPARKEHKRFSEVSHVVLNLLPSSTQMQGKTQVSKIAIGEAVSSGIVNNETLGYFMARIHLFLERIGISLDRLRFRQHLKNEMAHYACDCWDAEIKSSYGWIECVGCADRSAYDLTRHSERTKEKLVARERLDHPQQVRRTVLNINKKLFGPAFKKNAKSVEEALLGFSETELQQLEKDLQANGKIVVKASDGTSFDVGKDLISIGTVNETVHVLEYTPNVIEPSFGIGRIVYSLLEHVWWIRDGDENRHVLSFPASVAPIKCLIVPLSANDAFTPLVHDLSKYSPKTFLQNSVARRLRKLGVSNRVDDSGSTIGKRYARNDELGTPFALTVDFQTVQDGTITLRERDTTKQIREKVDTVIQVVRDLVDENTTWADVIKKYPEFVQQDI